MHNLADQNKFLNFTPTLMAFTVGHLCPWTLNPANMMQVSIMPSDESNRK